MDSLNQLEIQNIRHLTGMASNTCDKITYYKTLTSDQSVVKILEDVSSSLENLKTQLSNML